MTETRPTVWVIQEGQNDYSSAEEYGTVRFVTKAELTKFKDSQQNNEVDLDVRRFLSEYIAGVDYIIPSGNPMIVILTALLLPRGNHNFLKWDGRRAVYIPFNLTSTRGLKSE